MAANFSHGISLCPCSSPYTAGLHQLKNVEFTPAEVPATGGLPKRPAPWLKSSLRFGVGLVLAYQADFNGGRVRRCQTGFVTVTFGIERTIPLINGKFAARRWRARLRSGCSL